MVRWQTAFNKCCSLAMFFWVEEDPPFFWNGRSVVVGAMGWQGMWDVGGGGNTNRCYVLPYMNVHIHVVYVYHHCEGTFKVIH